jgi:hypothetical protein
VTGTTKIVLGGAGLIGAFVLYKMLAKPSSSGPALASSSGGSPTARAAGAAAGAAAGQGTVAQNPNDAAASGEWYNGLINGGGAFDTSSNSEVSDMQFNSVTGAYELAPGAGVTA